MGRVVGCVGYVGGGSGVGWVVLRECGCGDGYFGKKLQNAS